LLAQATYKMNEDYCILDVNDAASNTFQELLSLVKERVVTAVKNKYTFQQLHSQEWNITGNVVQEHKHAYIIGEDQIIKIIEARMKFMNNMFAQSYCNIFIRSSDDDKFTILGYALLKPIDIDSYLGLEMFEIFLNGHDLGRKFYKQLTLKYFHHTIMICNPRISALEYWNKLGAFENLKNIPDINFLRNHLRWDDISIEYIMQIDYLNSSL
jgi:hypothetical protein